MANIWSIVHSVMNGFEIESKDLPTQEEIDGIVWEKKDMYQYEAIDTHGVIYSFSIYACAYLESIPCSWLCFVYDYETFSVKAVQDTPGKALAAALCLARGCDMDLSSIVEIQRCDIDC